MTREEALKKIKAEIQMYDEESIESVEWEECYEALKKEPVLDKLRAEIEQERIGYPPSADYYKAIMKCLQILDKYRTEREVKDGRLDGRGTSKD